MFELITANWPVFLVAFLIGIATAWWAWARYHVAADGVAPVVEVPAVTPAPVVAPKIAVAEPVAVPVAAAVPAALMATAKAKPAPKPKVAAPKAVAPKAAAPKATAPKVAVKPAAPKAKVAAPKTKPVEAPKTAPVAKAKVETKAKPAAAPKPAAKPKAAPKIVIPDNLELLKGVGPKLNTMLKGLGVSSFEQVANWSAADIREIDSKLGAFAGRISRDNWIDQAKLLVKGDVAGFEKKYGALGSEIKKG